VQESFFTGDLSVAQSQASSARKRYARMGPEWPWKFRLLEAKSLVWQGRNRDAIDLIVEPLPASLEGGDLAIQRELILALAWARLGDVERSADAISIAKRLLDGLPASSSAVEFHNTLGILYMQQGDLSGSESSFRKALALSQSQGSQFWTASILLNLGVVALDKDHYDEALYWSHEASGTARTINAKIILEKALANEGWAYHELGDYERSLAASQQAAAEAEKLGSAIDHVRFLNNAGQDLDQLHEPEQAEFVYRRSLAIAETIRNQEEIANAHVALAYLLLEEEKDDAAWAEIDQALVARQFRKDEPAIFPLLLARALIYTHRSQFSEAESHLNSIYASPTMTPSLRWEVENAFANLYARQNKPAQAEGWYRKSIDTFERQRLSVKQGENRLPFFGNADQLYEDYITFLVGRGRQEQALQILDEGRARTLREGLNTSITAQPSGVTSVHRTILDPRAVARALNGTVLEYSIGEKRSYLWAINSRSIRIFELPGRAEIDGHVREYQRSILNSVDVLAKKDEAGMWLHRKLVAPASSMIPQGGKVFLIADGSLNNVNFETFLVSSPQPHFWIEDVTLTSADSLQLLQSFRKRPMAKTSPKLLLIGDPVSSSSEFADLPNAPAEVRSVAAHFEPVSRTVITHGAASPAAYGASHPDQFTYIHFVAHGVANHLSPLDSAVLLSPASTRPDSFKLYARDIVQQPLHAELVTISTCYGSGTKSYAGEGLVGLSWAFLRAGSHNVIGAMWAVSDASTPALMNDLYTNLEKGSQPDVALRTAKLSLAHSAGVYRKPLYWGAFQLYAGS
jgi:CHAT domain-containing protein